MISIRMDTGWDIRLLEALRENNAETIQNFTTDININLPLGEVIKDAPKNISKKMRLDYSKWKDKNPLQIVCLEDGPNALNCVKLLLTERKANPLYEVMGTEKTAIHYAAEGGNEEILTELFGKLSESDLLNEKLDNIFYTLIRYIKFNERENEIRYKPIFTLLLQKGLDINIPDIETGWTPIYAAASYKLKEITTLILKHGQIDLESFKDREGKCAKDLIKDNNLYDNIDSTYIYTYNDKQMLYKYIRENQIEEFRQKLPSIYDTLTEFTKLKLLDLAVREEQRDIVQCLLEIDISNAMCSQKHDLKYHPMVQACKMGYYKIVSLFVDKDPSCELVTISILEVTKPYGNYIIGETDYGKVVRDLFRCIKLEINIQDSESNTLLHHAVRFQNPDMVLALLNNGASMACKDTNGKLPIEEMNSELLEEHLNNCISYFYQSCLLKKEFLFKFTSLLPPRKGTTGESEEIKDTDEYPIESEVLQYMSNSSELKHLLTHPVILAFIYMKWQRLGGFFLTDLAICLFFVASLVTYIVFNVSYVLLVVALVLLIIRELFQMIIFNYRYIYEFENWLQLFLSVITSAMIFYEGIDKVQRQLSAIAIIMCAIDFVLLLGRIPCMSTNITILRTICWSFLTLMFWYSILLSGFAYGFHILFGDTESNNTEKSNFFANMGFSLLKTITMALGELDTTSLDFDLYPPSSYLVFLIFVFFIAIVLFNLMISLAISDTEKIKNNAEIYEQKLLVDYIAQIEALSQIFCKCPPFIAALFKRVAVFPLINDGPTKLKIDPSENTLMNIYCFFNLCTCTELHLNKNVELAILKKIETNINSNTKRKFGTIHVNYT